MPSWWSSERDELSAARVRCWRSCMVVHSDCLLQRESKVPSAAIVHDLG